jgi:hypothetical protein
VNRYGGRGICRANKSLMIVPNASLKRTPLGSVWGSHTLAGLSFGDDGGWPIMSSSTMGCTGGGWSSMDVTTFSSPSARRRRLWARGRSCLPLLSFSSLNRLGGSNLAFRLLTSSPSLPTSSSSS